MLRFISANKALEAEIVLLKAELAAARAQVSDLLSRLQSQSEAADDAKQKLVDRLIALASPQAHTLLNPPPPRTPLPREPQKTRWPGWRPNTEPIVVLPETPTKN